MAELLRRGTFAADDLTAVTPPANPVLLKSGGPIMSLVERDGLLAVCEWPDGRAIFPITSLYRLVPFDWPQ